MARAIAEAFVQIRPDVDPQEFRIETSADVKKALAGIDGKIKVTADVDATKMRALLQAKFDLVAKGLSDLKLKADSRDAVLKVEMLSLQADRLSRKLASQRLTISGMDRASIDLLRLQLQADKLNRSLKIKTGGGGITGALGRFFTGGGGITVGGGAAAGAAGSGASGASALLPGGAPALANPYVLAGGVAAALAALPFAAQAAAGGIVTALGGALVGIGILGASKTKEVQNQFADLSKNASADLTKISAPFDSVMVHILKTAQSTLGKLVGPLTSAMKTLAGPFQVFSEALIKAFGQPAVAKAIQAVAGAFADILKALTPQLAGDVADIAGGIQKIAQAIAKNPGAFAGFISFLFKIAGFALTAIGWLTNLATYVEKHFGPVFKSMTKTVGDQIDSIKKTLEGHGIGIVWKHLWDGLLIYLKAILPIIGGVLKIGFDFLAAVVKVVLDVLQGHWKTAWTDIKAFGSQIWHIIAGILKGVWDSLPLWLKKDLDRMRHDTAVIFDGIRHEIAHVWDVIWNNTIGAVIRIAGDVKRWDERMRHDIAVIFDGIRHDIAHYWDVIYNDTIGAVIRLSKDVIKFFHDLPGNIVKALGDLGTLLIQSGKDLLTGLWNGIKTVWDDVVSWFKGLPGKILSALGISSPPKWAIEAGHHIMGGILKGIAHNAANVEGFFLNLATNITGPLRSVWDKLIGLGSGKYPAGVAQYTATAASVLKMLGQPMTDLPVVLAQMTTESGGNPYAVNRSDINWQLGHPSVGLMQVIQGTFDAYAGPFRSVGPFSYGVSEDPLANIYAGLNYAIHRYGQNWTNVLGHGHGYDKGGILPPGVTLAVNRTGQPELITPLSQLSQAIATSLPSVALPGVDGSWTGDASLGDVVGTLQDVGDSITGAISMLASITAGVGDAAGASMGSVLNGVARASGYAAMYNSRP